MDAFLFYAYWNGEQVRDLFEALAGITASPNFTMAAAMLFLLGMIVVIGVGATRGEGKSIITYFACAVLFWFIAAVPKASVAIEDTRSETVYTVDNIPLGIAFFGSLANRLGYWLTNTYETAFAPVDVARFSKFGAVYPERVLEVLQSVGPVTTEGRAVMDAVIEACVTPELLTDDAKAMALMTSVDLWATVSTAGWVNPARLAAMPDGRVLHCNDAMTEAAKVLNDVELPQLKKVLGAKLAPSSLDPSSALAAAIPQAEGHLLNLSRSMDASLRHSLMLTAVPQGLESRMAGTNSPVAMSVSLAKAQGNLASEINYRTMAKIAHESLPRIRNAIEFAVIAMFPLMVLIALVSGSAMGGIVRTYFTLLVAVQVWPALASVINYLMITYDAEPFGAIAREFAGNSLAATALIRETGATSQAVAGALMCAVPVMAYALVRGGDMAVGNLVSGLMGPAQSAASAQGASLAAGNVSQGNVQLGNTTSNNVSSNHSDRSVSVADPGTLKTTTAYGSITRADGGEVTGMQRTAVDMGVGATTTQGYVRGHGTTHMAQVSSVTTDAARFSFGQALNSSDATQRSFAHAFRDALNQEQGLSTVRSASETAGSSASVVFASEMGATNSVTEGTGIRSHIRLSTDVQTPHVLSPENWHPSSVVLNTDAAHSDVVRQPASSIGTPTTSMPTTAMAVNVGPGRKNAGRYEFGNQEALGETGLILGSETSFNDAQNLLEQATGRSATSSAGQRSEALSKVESALERVANTSTDEAVRSTARSMQQSLANNRSYAHDSTQSQVESVTAASNLNESKSGAFQTQADQSVFVMQSAVRRYGTAEGALRAMYDRKEQLATAADAYWERHAAVETKEGFGPSTVQSAKAAAAEVKDNSQSELEKKDAEFASSVGTVAMDAPTGEPTNISGAYQATVRDMDAARSARMGDVDFERGVLMLSREAYKQDQEDKNFAFRNAFFAGLGYQSPDEVQDGLRSAAASNPELAREISEVGRMKKPEIDQAQWDRLVNQTR